MALLHFDGFECWGSTAQFSTQISPNISAAVLSGFAPSGNYARNGSYGVRLKNSYGGDVLAYSLSSNLSTIIVGFAMLRADTTAPSYSNSYPTFGFRDGADYQLKFHVIENEIEVRNNAGTLLGTTVGAGLSIGAWRYIEIKATIHDTNGIVIIRSDNIEVLSLSAIDTKNTANAYVNKFYLLPIYSNIDIRYDDLYICDTSGSKNNDFLGDSRVDPLRPNGSGTYTDLTPSAGSNYQNVDDSPGNDGDTTYNYSSTVGNKDLYALPSLPSPPSGATIHGVKAITVARKSDVGAKEMKSLIRAGSTDQLGAAQTLSESYIPFSDIYENNPDDAAAWEDADVNALEAGVEVTA